MKIMIKIKNNKIEIVNKKDKMIKINHISFSNQKLNKKTFRSFKFKMKYTINFQKIKILI